MVVGGGKHSVFILHHLDQKFHDLIFLMRIFFLYRLLLWCSGLVIFKTKQPFRCGGMIEEMGFKAYRSLFNCWWWIIVAQTELLSLHIWLAKRSKVHQWVYSNWFCILNKYLRWHITSHCTYKDLLVHTCTFKWNKNYIHSKSLIFPKLWTFSSKYLPTCLILTL